MSDDNGGLWKSIFKIILFIAALIFMFSEPARDWYGNIREKIFGERHKIEREIDRDRDYDPDRREKD